MLLLGHAGIALGVVRALDSPLGARVLKPSARLYGRIDYRLVLVGSLLPDIIDKPTTSSRAFAHTLLFTLIIALIGLYMYKRWGRSGMLILSFGSLLHLLLDEMWASPTTLFWPIYGWHLWGFAPGDLMELILRIIRGLSTNPQAHVLVGEIVGAIVIAGFILELFWRKKTSAFIKTGAIR
jgi:membrane-bound metal-dependent hydrolase YbcI (DUF457 family)